MSASREQIAAALSQLVAHQNCFDDWSARDLQNIVTKPKQSIDEWKSMIADRRRKVVIPTSSRTNSESSFVFDVGGHVDSHSLYSNTRLSDGSRTKFDGVSRDLIVVSRVLDRSDFTVLQPVSFKVMTLVDFGFEEDHVETGVFMNDDFLRAWSRKHYKSRTLSLCKDTDFLYATIGDCFASVSGIGYTFAMKSVTHDPSCALYIFKVNNHSSGITIPYHNISATAAHNERPWYFKQRFVFRITDNNPRSK